MKIILASASPRRKELLSLITNDFIVEKSDAEEILPVGISPSEASEYLAALKASDISVKFPNDIVIGCDTTVIIDNKILGKPQSDKQCSEYLRLLSGRTHQVITGCCIMCNAAKTSFSVVTDVTFRKLSDDDISSYIATGEPFDKAGGYGIQGKGSLLVEKINGDYFNVVGLPVSRLNIEINKFKENL
ncbi:MAG: septum formation inhibitor Maf [Ruminococcus sp.]|nr:septum formation inhibitor Maf [Ruminococcus sp.]MBO5383653.1 septum formation inhibitor Maf [Ruminococcus sp.]MBR6670178.1 septum formation inhibitor Maf [Ruminococcus sp.]